MDDDKIWWMEIGTIDSQIHDVKYTDSFKLVEIEKFYWDKNGIFTMKWM